MQSTCEATCSPADGARMTTFRILTVCTGNICRSVVAEQYLKQRMASFHRGDFEVTSAGTGVNPLLVPPPEIVQILERHHLDGVEGRSPRPIDRDVLQSADLVLAATGEHLRQVLTERPALLRRSFTIKEFALGAGHVGTDKGAGDRTPAALVDAVSRLRSRVRLNQDLDLADPFDQDTEAYASMERELLPLLDQIADALASRR